MDPTLRHACQRCGASCTGHRVLLQEGEAARVEALAQALGVDDPIAGASLRQVDGRCVFLTPDQLCGLHAHAGADAKPLACRQYPLVVVRVEDDVRLGLDPGCLTTWRTWRTGPPLVPGRTLASRVLLAPEQLALEAWVLTLCERSETVGELLGALVDEAPVDGLPPVWARSWAAGCRAVGLPAPASVPPWSLGAEAEALAVETVRRLIHLRLARERGPPDEIAGLLLGGALLAAWRDPALPAFGTGLAQWSRALRQPGFYAHLQQAAP